MKSATPVAIEHDTTEIANAVMYGMRCKEMWPDSATRIGMLFMAPGRLWCVWSDSLTCLNELLMAFRDGAHELGWLIAQAVHEGALDGGKEEPRLRRHLAALAGATPTDAHGILDWMGVEKGFYWWVIFHSAKEGRTENVYSHEPDPESALLRKIRAGLVPVSYFRFRPSDPVDTAELVVVPPFGKTDEVLKPAMGIALEDMRRYFAEAV
jgi:hypothetical protein